MHSGAEYHLHLGFSGTIALVDTDSLVLLLDNKAGPFVLCCCGHASNASGLSFAMHWTGSASG